MKRVEVVVLNWNGWRDTLVCLASLQRLSYPNFGLIVVDNGSTDGSQDQIEARFPAIKVLQTGANLGFGGGCNAGIRRALEQGADYVWLINSDTTVDADALTELVHVADEQAQAGAVGSVLYELDRPEHVQLWGGGKVQLWSGLSRHQLMPASLDFISGASMLLRREAIEQVGLFDDQTFFMYWEDSDLGFRLRQAGWLLAVAERSHVWHKLSASLGKGSPLLDLYFTQSGVRFLRRYAPVASVSVLVMVARMLLKRLLMGDVGRVKAVFKGYLGA
ncbi:glycosyltransferase family 2 protein [Rhodoferax sp.]|uniref:glycosyltransferase family 2 protein n=1 Tax=Rhodoferax sp. TaxID=50421 RepID=UPI00260744A5|nr:glycosyltransferase family 2 protein [Rhodoferax sp.]MDD3935660.1 glycosyltransferase family 2 protein [Rhodoferax sp.]